MTHRFKKHYTLDEARALLPSLREWLDRLNELRVELEQNERRLAGLRTAGQDLGGEAANKSVYMLGEIQDLLKKFHNRQIFIKDLAKGLVDFPALIDGKEVFLCWERDEDDIEFWHDLDSGYAGRERL